MLDQKVKRSASFCGLLFLLLLITLSYFCGFLAPNPNYFGIWITWILVSSIGVIICWRNSVYAIQQISFKKERQTLIPAYYRRMSKTMICWKLASSSGGREWFTPVVVPLNRFIREDQHQLIGMFCGNDIIEGNKRIFVEMQKIRGRKFFKIVSS